MVYELSLKCPLGTIVQKPKSQRKFDKLSINFLAKEDWNKS
jgi:hypothetical protein